MVGSGVCAASPAACVASGSTVSPGLSCSPTGVPTGRKSPQIKTASRTSSTAMTAIISTVVLPCTCFPLILSPLRKAACQLSPSARTSAVAVARSTSYSAKSASTSSSSVRSSCNVFQSSNPLSLRLSIPWSFWAVSPTGIKICSPAISRSTNSLVAFKLPPSVANTQKPCGATRAARSSDFRTQ